jgi:hypothetical protein
MTDLERLLAIEDIKKVKAKYFYGWIIATESCGGTKSGRPTAASKFRKPTRRSSR